MSPLDLVKSDALACEWDPAPYLLFSAEVEPFVYYTHLFPALAVLILALVILIRNHKPLTSKLFIVIAGLFATFAIFDLILWATERPSLIMFLWSLLTYIEPLIYAATLYLVLVYARGRDVSLWSKLAVAGLLMPVILLGPTSLNLTGFDYTSCDRLAVEGPLLLYVYAIEFIFVIWMIVGAWYAIRNLADTSRRTSIWFLLAGSLLFLLAFSSGNIFGTLLQGVMGEEAWVIGQYGLFGMPIFLGFIMYLIVRFEVFNARVIYAEAITIALWVLLLSLLFIPDRVAAQPVIIVTLVLFGILGYFLINGVKQDIEQKKEIEKLAKRLKTANNRLRELDKIKSEFVSIASHQLRSPLTSIRGYASMILEGSFGKVGDKAREAVERINESSRSMALSVEDYLNVSRIESGNMKYEMADFNIKNEAKQIVDDIRPQALKKGLLLMYKSDVDSHGIVNADIGKVRQILHNLINNSLKYTPEGKINIFVHDDKKKKKIYVDVTDTGVGMDEDALDTVFDKFVRAKNANQVNVTGTGLGLYLARKMASDMKGNISATSPGEGKGATFTLELPLQM